MKKFVIDYVATLDGAQIIGGSFFLTLMSLLIMYIVFNITSQKYKKAQKKLDLENRIVEITNDALIALILFTSDDRLTEDQILSRLSISMRQKVESMFPDEQNVSPVIRISYLRNDVPRKLIMRAREFFDEHSIESIAESGSDLRFRYVTANSLVNHVSAIAEF